MGYGSLEEDDIGETHVDSLVHSSGRLAMRVQIAESLAHLADVGISTVRCGDITTRTRFAGGTVHRAQAAGSRSMDMQQSFLREI